ncbi:hypothetical protein HHOHNEGG_00022 [Clostridium phage LPCPA6]|uniref:DUF3789 domain-containing protein n=1 Tax=Clostridium phage LPCPA6 TaxID=2924884 RepID=A0AAE9G9U8_9CAUD|nr:hypothetical protein PQC33_gp22 [Clostridium phage LPCPA6]UNY47199.1 hypothetical protein HHOHNEGG_00022 [Clostridium phage LPCPA6]
MWLGFAIGYGMGCIMTMCVLYSGFNKKDRKKG